MKNKSFFEQLLCYLDRHKWQARMIIGGIIIDTMLLILKISNFTINLWSG